MNELVFVYGTLKTGHGNHGVIEGNSKYVGDAHVGNGYSLHDIGHGFPYMVKGSGSGCFGELFKVNEKAIERMDMLEGHPSFYKRTKCEVTDVGGKKLKAWTYIYQGVIDDDVPAINEWN